MHLYQNNQYSQGKNTLEKMFYKAYMFTDRGCNMQVLSTKKQHTLVNPHHRCSEVDQPFDHTGNCSSEVDQPFDHTGNCSSEVYHPCDILPPIYS